MQRTPGNASEGRHWNRARRDACWKLGADDRDGAHGEAPDAGEDEAVGRGSLGRYRYVAGCG